MGSISTSSDEPVSNLRPITRYITTHREDGKAIIHSAEHVRWQGMRNNEVGINLLYTTSEFPTQLNHDEDIKAHTKVSQLGTGLVNKGGSVCRICDFAPGNNPMMHRTKSLDYGVVLEGEMNMVLDSGETVLLKRGDVAVQRGTMHAWQNASATEWGRMLFVLLDSHPLELGEGFLKESLAPEQHEFLPSDNGSSSFATAAHIKRSWSPAPAGLSLLPTSVTKESHYLLHHWTENLAAALSTAYGCDNPFLVYLTPMLAESASLRFVTSSMAARHLAILRNDKSLGTVACRYQVQALSSLRRTIETESPALSLAAIVMMQISDRIFTADNSVNHLAGANAIIMRNDQQFRWKDSSSRFLLSLCFYYDILSSISRIASPTLDLPDAGPLEGLPYLYKLSQILQLVGKTSRLQGSDGMDLIIRGQSIQASLASLRTSDCDQGDITHTTEAYRYAAMIYLQRVCLNTVATYKALPSLGLPEQCIFHLRQVSATSPLASAHLWPLWTAGCESTNFRERQFVRERLDAMFEARHLPSLLRARKDIEEVWSLKDNQRFTTGIDNIDCIQVIWNSRNREAALV
ncbi:hypothetical protein GQ53DRAFT_821539 [Thozetella sp. PMI_491]|nr:hypothetical protein GQ53DRAFT_821539 [Thozetella sp. PMI_491]